MKNDVNKNWKFHWLVIKNHQYKTFHLIYVFDDILFLLKFESYKYYKLVAKTDPFLIIIQIFIWNGKNVTLHFRIDIRI